MNQQSIHERIMSREAPTTSHQAGPLEVPKKARGLARILVVSALGAVFVAGVGFAALNVPAVRSVFAQDSAAAPIAPELPDTPFLQHTRQAAISSCSVIYPVLGQLLTAGADYSVQTQWDPVDADKHAIQALVGLNYQTEAYRGPAAGIVFAAPNGSGCEGGMVRVAPLPVNCTTAITALPSGSVATDPLAGLAIYELPEKSGQAMLLPAGEACVVISIARAAAL